MPDLACRGWEQLMADIGIQQADLDRLIDKACDIIGTDKDLRCWECIEIALDHAIARSKYETLESNGQNKN